MPRGVVKSGHGGGLALFLFTVPAVLEPGVTALATLGFPEVAEASPFGCAGTVAVCLAAAGLAVAGAVLALRGVGGALRSTLAVLLGAAAGLVAVMAFYFLFAGSVVLVFAMLLIHATFSLAMIARAVARSTPTSTSR